MISRRGNFGRVRLVSALFSLLALILLVRLYELQIIKHDYYVELSDRQYVRPVGGVFNRGNIFFSDKSGLVVSAATLKNGFTLAIKPGDIFDPESVFSKLHGFLPNLDRRAFLEKAAKKEDPYEELVRRVSQNFLDKITSLEIPGVLTERERWRFYPGERTASHVLGFVGFKGDALSGRYGVERYYDDILGRDTAGHQPNFFAELFGFAASTRSPFGGEGDLVLTIEPTVQSFTEELLKKTKDRWNAREIGAIIINPKDGSLYTMAALPDFSPNDFNTETDISVFLNPLVEKVYEMGSTFKPLTMAAGLDFGAVKANSTYKDEGYGILNGRRFSNYDGKGRGVVSMQEVLNQSLNTGAAYVASKIGYEEFARYLRAYGIGEETGIDLPNEAPGLVKNLDSGQAINFATASFGQGVAVSPISLVRALSVLGNGGVLVTPHVGKEVRYTSGIVHPLSYPVGERVIKPETSEEITRMLVEVVDKALLSGTVKDPRLSVAAKTGTAQVPKPGGGYYEDRYLHSFFGYFPAYDPRFLVFLYILYPEGARYSSETLTGPFIQIKNFLVSYYSVLPDR